jgi:hypothetical protein
LPRNHQFSFTIIGPFQDQLAIEGDLINGDFLKPKDVLESIFRRLSLDKILYLNGQNKKKMIYDAQQTLLIENKLHCSIVKLIDILFLIYKVPKAFRKKKLKEKRGRRMKKKVFKEWKSKKKKKS